jgi:histidinol dehydrogenase
MATLARLDSAAADFDARLAALQPDAADAESGHAVEVAHQILADVRRRGDAAVLERAQRLDGATATAVAELELTAAALDAARARLADAERDALEAAAERLTAYAERQRLESDVWHDAEGNLLGQQVAPLERVGLYVPGGKAAYPSSVLMNAIPAKTAGVGELIMTVPMPAGEVSDLVLAAAALAGVDRVFALGGAQAVAALAYGTATVPAVDKIVGPGNAYVTAAKRLVYGRVGIDMVAGPSEILVICDGATEPEWIALDLFAQAEHDEQARAVLVAWDGDFLDRVAAAIERLLAVQPRRQIIASALAARGALVQVRDLDEAVALANRIAPEHLELSLDDAADVAPRIRHAGAIFLGRHTPEALGDYCAGPNHVLPTARTARFTSPLGVYDFQKRTSLLGCTPAGAARLAPTAATLAHAEGLAAHAASAMARAGAADAGASADAEADA